MKFTKLLLFTFAFFIVFSITMFGAEKTKRKHIYIIEGSFFYKMPKKMENSTISIIETPNGTTACGLILSEPLSQDFLKLAVPDDSIPEAKELKQLFAEFQLKDSLWHTGKHINIGDKFPDFSAIDLNGKVWTNADVAGKPMVLNQWYTGCKPCRAEMPELSEWKDEMPDVMFFSSTYETADRAKPVLDKIGFNWTHLVNDRQFLEWLGGKGYPMTIVVDKNGIITHIEFGTSPEQRATLKSKIEAVRSV